MSYKTILVCMSHPDDTKRLATIASDIARRFRAHLIGLYVMPAFEVHPEVAMELTRGVMESFYEDREAERKAIEAEFKYVTDKEDFVSEWRCERASSRDVAQILTDHARCADLVIMLQPSRDEDRVQQKHLQRDVIEACGRPVLVVPYVGECSTIGQHALIGWSATKEATRSAHDVIPFLTNDESVAEFFCVSHSANKKDKLENSAHQMAACFNRHGIETRTSHRSNSQLSIGDEILNQAADSGADMIVSGAFGHSRVYDFLVGATTPHLMKQMTVPVLFSC